MNNAPLEERENNQAPKHSKEQKRVKLSSPTLPVQSEGSLIAQAALVEARMSGATSQPVSPEAFALAREFSESAIRKLGRADKELEKFIARPGDQILSRNSHINGRGAEGFPKKLSFYPMSLCFGE